MSRIEDRKTLRELLVGGGRHLGAALAGLLTYPIVARLLDADGLGAWAILGAAAFLLNLTDLGLTTSLQRAAVAKEFDRAHRILGLSLLVISALAPLVGVGAYIFLIDIPGDLSPEFRQDAARAAWVTLLAGGVMAWTSPFRGYLYARGGVRDVARARTLASTVQVAALGIGFFFARSLLVPAIALLVGYLVDLVIVLRAARRLQPGLPMGPRRPTDLGEAKAAFRDGAAQLLVNMSVVTALRVDLFVLVRVAPLAVVAAYGVAGRAVDQAYLLAKQATVALMPRLGDPAHRARAVRIGTAVFSGVIASGMAALSFDGQQLLVGWVGDVAAGATPALVLMLLAGAAMLMSTYEVTGSMVMLSARTGWACAVPIFIGSAINLGISVTFADEYGVWAVAGSTIVGNTITLFLMWATARHLLEWSLMDVLTALAPFITAVVIGAALGYTLSPFANEGIGQSFVACVITGSCALVCSMGVMKLSGKRFREPTEDLANDGTAEVTN